MSWMKTVESLMNMNNILLIRVEDNQVIFYSTNDREIKMDCDNKEHAIKRLTEIFEKLNER